MKLDTPNSSTPHHPKKYIVFFSAEVAILLHGDVLLGEGVHGEEIFVGVEETVDGGSLSLTEPHAGIVELLVGLLGALGVAAGPGGRAPCRRRSP